MRALLVSLLLAAGAATPAQQIVQTGPPPKIRALIEGFIQAVNGDDVAWEAYAQARYAPALLKAQGLPERAALHRQIVDRFGAVSRGRVRREGSEGPLEISIQGTKAAGTSPSTWMTPPSESRGSHSIRRRVTGLGRCRPCPSTARSVTRTRRAASRPTSGV